MSSGRSYVVLALALAGIAGCGGGSSSEATVTATPTPAASTKGPKTAPGTRLALGETARVDIKPLSGDEKKRPIDVAVLKIEKGTIEDFKNVNLDADQKGATPYYVTVRVANPAGEIPVKTDDPDIRFAGVDDRGQEQRSVTFIGTFARCDDKNAPAPFTRGKAYQSCLTYLMPGGGSIEQVRWQGSDKYILKPVVWK
jgi:hypothetical protein